MIKSYVEEYEYREDVNGGGKSASGQGEGNCPLPSAAIPLLDLVKMTSGHLIQSTNPTG